MSKNWDYFIILELGKKGRNFAAVLETEEIWLVGLLKFSKFNIGVPEGIEEYQAI